MDEHDMHEHERIEGTDSARTYKLLRLRIIIKDNRFCVCCAHLYGVRGGENYKHSPERSWKSHRRTQYKPRPVLAIQ